MLNKCVILGVIYSKEFDVTTTSTGKRCIKFTIINRREYKEGGIYKVNKIRCESWKPAVVNYILTYFESGSRIAVIGEFKVDSYQDDAGAWHSKAFLNMHEVYGVTTKKSLSTTEEKDEDYEADVAQVDWGDGF